MTKNQLLQSIEELTQAMAIIVNVAGIGGDATTQQIMNGISEQRSKLQKRLRDLEQAQRRVARELNRLETTYSVLEAQLNEDHDKLSDQQFDAIKNRLDALYAQIKETRGEK